LSCSPAYRGRYLTARFATDLHGLSHLKLGQTVDQGPVSPWCVPLLGRPCCDVMLVRNPQSGQAVAHCTSSDGKQSTNDRYYRLHDRDRSSSILWLARFAPG